jgi:Methyltransferase domain
MSGSSLDISGRVRDLDTRLFKPILAQTAPSDRRALLALHEATARRYGPFVYLEIGSYLGGSLQALVRDPRCARIISIDPRPDAPPDKRTGTWPYADNTTAHMLELLGGLPGADLSKLVTLEVGTDALTPDALPARPHYCFVDGEHTDEAALRDARFCADALGGRGVIAFHDDNVVREGIEAFLHEAWGEVSMAVAFAGSVFAVELGNAGILRSRVVDLAIGSAWHSLLWRIASKPRRSPAPLLTAWSALPMIDKTIYNAQRRMARA